MCVCGGDPLQVPAPLKPGFFILARGMPTHPAGVRRRRPGSAPSPQYAHPLPESGDRSGG